MLVSHRKRFIYTKTIKTGSTTVEVYFEPWCFPEGRYEFSGPREPYVSDTGIVGFRGVKRPDDGYVWYNHMPASEIRDRLPAPAWNEYFKFCCVRNPFNRMVSAFHHLVQPKEACATLPFPVIREQFQEWIRSRRFETEHRLDDWTICSLDDVLCVDYVIRHEELAKGIEAVCRRLDIPFEPARIQQMQGHYNPRIAPVADYYDQATLDIVGTAYARQLKEFGYHPPR